MAIQIPGLRIDSSAGDTGLSPLVEPRSALSEAGAGIDIMADVQMRKEKRDSDAYIAEKSTELLLESQDLLNNVINETEDPNNITSTFNEKYNRLYSDKLSTAPNALARRELEQKNMQFRQSFGKAAIAEQANAVQAVRVDKFNKSANSLINEVRNSGNLQLGQVGLETLYENMASSLSVAEMLEFRNNTQNQVKTSYLDRAFEAGNLSEVRAKINDDDFAQDLNPRQVDAYRKAIKAEQKRLADAAAARNSIKLANGGDGSGARVYTDKKEVNALFNNIGFADMFIDDNPFPLGSEENPRLTDLINNLDERGVQGLAQLTKATGMLPSDAKSFIQGALVSNNDNVRAYGSELINELSQTAWRAFEQSGLSEKQLLEAREYNRLKAQGMPANDIAARLKTEFNPVSGELYEARKAEINKGDVKPSRSITQSMGAYLDVLDIFDPALPEVPEYASQIESEYNSIWNDYYVMTGSTDAADKRTDEIIPKFFYVSKVTGKDVVLKNAPEVVAGIAYYDTPDGNNNHVWQRPQLLEGVKKATGKANIKIDDVILLSDILTEKALRQGMEPSYKVFTMEGGEPEEVSGRFMFDRKKAAGEFESKTLKQREKDVDFRRAMESRPTPMGTGAEFIGDLF